MLPPSGIFSANCCSPFDAISLLDITLFWEWWPRLVPGSAPLLSLKLFSVFYTLACGAVHAALSCSKTLLKFHMQINLNQKNPNTSYILTAPCFWGFFHSVFFSPLHFVLLMFFESMRQKLFCQEFLNPLTILIFPPLALAVLFP